MTASLDEGAADDLLRGAGSVARHLLARFDGLDDVHAFADLTKHGVVAVEPRRRDGGDEELRSAGVTASVGHRQNAGAVVLQGEGRGFAGNLPAGATGACAPGHGVLGVRATSLQHEISNDAVEVKAVVVSVADEFHEVRNRIRRVSVVEL